MPLRRESQTTCLCSFLHSQRSCLFQNPEILRANAEVLGVYVCVFFKRLPKIREQKERAFLNCTGHFKGRAKSEDLYKAKEKKSILKSERNYLELTYSCKYVVLLNYAGIELNYFILLLSVITQDVRSLALQPFPPPPPAFCPALPIFSYTSQPGLTWKFCIF